MAYNGSVGLISGICPKGGTHPIADAKDIYVSDEERLDAALVRLKTSVDSLPKIIPISREDYEALVGTEDYDPNAYYMIARDAT